VDSKEKHFLGLLETHKGILYKVGRMYTNTFADREDLQQEIIIQLWKSYGSFKGDSLFSSWMYRVAVNTAITFFKNEKKRSDTLSYDQIPEPELENDNSEKDLQMEVFYAAVQRLSSVEKAIILYFMEGLSHKEIGLQLGITELNARVKLSRTKEKLQQLIKNTGYES
jgi:RNA polymerase sigma factor (sigma-70 family)